MLTNTMAKPLTSQKVLKRQSQTRQRILDTSAALFIAKGFENVSVEEIIDGADIARSSFYRFFGNREDLLTQMIRPVFERGIADMDAIRTLDPVAIMKGIFDVYLDLWRSNKNALRVSTRVGGKHFYLFEDLHREYRANLIALVENVERSGILLSGNADYTARLIARSAVPTMEVYRDDPDFEQLFHKTMQGALLCQESIQ